MSDHHNICLANYYRSPQFKVIKTLRPLQEEISRRYFNSDITFMSRDEYADGSCFFHSVATCINAHKDPSGGCKLQEKLFKNLQHVLLSGGVQDESKTSKFNNFLHKHLFVHDDYHLLSESEQTRLGHELRYFIRSTLDNGWNKFWKFSDPNIAHKLRNVHGKDHVRELLSNPSVWADVYMILYVMHVLNINIWFIDNEFHRLYCGVQGTSISTQPTIIILWTDHRHFQPIVKLECDGDKSYIKALFDYEDDVVRHIEQMYDMDGCSAVSSYDRL